LTLIPWQAGKALTWDVTVICPLAVIWQHRTQAIAARKTAKYAVLECRYLFQPIAVESLGPVNCSAVAFLRGLGRRTAEVSGKIRDGSFLYQHVDSMLQCSSASRLLC